MNLDSSALGTTRRSVPPHTHRAARLRRWMTALALAGAALGALPLAARPAAAQEPAGGEARRWSTRADLERYAAQLEAAAASGRGTNQTRAEAAAIRTRLREGDFPPGTPIVVTPTSTVGMPQEVLQAFQDTLRVRAGRVLQVPGLPDLPLAGVLRSELQTALTEHLARNIRNPSIRAGTFIPVEVSGQASRPGYYTVPSDMLVTELVMHAGGPNGTADLQRSVVKRAGAEIIGSDSLQAAIRSQATLDQIGFQSGDALVIGEKRETNWRTIVSVIGGISSVAYLVLSLTNR